jgi:hypothetical protein
MTRCGGLVTGLLWVWNARVEELATVSASAAVVKSGKTRRKACFMVPLLLKQGRDQLADLLSDPTVLIDGRFVGQCFRRVKPNTRPLAT